MNGQVCRDKKYYRIMKAKPKTIPIVRVCSLSYGYPLPKFWGEKKSFDL